MTRLVALLALLALAGCAGAPQKSLTPQAGYSDFRSALHLAGETPASRTLVYIVALEGDALGLVTHIGRTDGRFPGITQARSGTISLPYERVSSQQGDGMRTESGMIALTPKVIGPAARTGMMLELCGAGTCYRADVPAELFVQALVE